MSPATGIDTGAVTMDKIALDLTVPIDPKSLGAPRLAVSEKPAAKSETPIYYSPREPAMGILSESHGTIVHFGHGRMQTEDPLLLEALEKGVKDGRYFKADLSITLTCGKCGLPWKNQKAYEIHVQSHNVE